MKMVLAVVQDKDSVRLAGNLTQQGIRATKLASTGGFLHAGNTTFMIGIEDDKVSDVLDIIRSSCRAREEIVTPMASVGSQFESYGSHPVAVQVGGATVFVIHVEQFEQF